MTLMSPRGRDGIIEAMLQPAPTQWSPVRRSLDGRMVAGVAAGLASALHLRPWLVRAAFIALALAGGVGLLLYVLGWLLVPVAGSPESVGGAAMRRRQDLRPVAAVGMIVLGSLLLLRLASPFGFNDALVWPVVIAAMGLYVIWRQADQDDRAALTRVTSRLPTGERAGMRRPGAVARVLGGAGLVALGVALFLATHNALTAVRDGILAIAAIVGGIAIVLGPLWWRLVRDLTEERRERIRSQERAEVAAHLHDSVLQTLSLIQRSAGDSRTVTTLARKQERELRSWLFPPATAAARDESVAAAVERVAAEIEEHHRVAVDAVTVGDCPLDDALAASVVPAAREALINAAQHAGVDNVSLYVEVEPERVTVFVRDRGGGFDPAAVNVDRQGIAESIVGRMARHGGTGTVRSERGHGTEVQLVLPRGGRR